MAKAADHDAKRVLKAALADKPARSRVLTARAADARQGEFFAPGAKRKAAGEAAPDADTLARYRAKRDFHASPEPSGGTVAGAAGHRFVVQKHDARRLHYDLRLELDGVLLSWAVTRGPSLVPGDKRLAVRTEDHPLDYIAFEGVIPAGQYGGGTMIVWDTGTWRPEGDPGKDLARGRLTFTLEGERLRGRWHLVRTRGAGGKAKENWLLLKSDDAQARPAGAPDILTEHATSVLTGRTNADLARGGEIRPDHAARGAAKARREASGRAATAARPPARGARKAILPAFVEPCLASLAEVAPDGEDWIHEIKFDGYRVQARIEGDDVRLLTRKGLDWTDRFGSIAAGLRDLGLGAALIDGEIVVEDENGIASFSGLQAALKAGRSDGMVYHAFDLLHLDGRDMRGAALADRKAALALAIDDLPAGGPVRLSEHLTGDGAAMIRHACRLGLEGIVSKRSDAPYRSGRSDRWLKVKCTQRQECVIAGYVPSSTSSKRVGSLVLGVFDGDAFVHVGRVGTGFSAPVARDLRDELEPLKLPAAPFAATLPAEAARGVRWVRPERVAEVEFRGWTTDGILRHASFKGLRDDKDPRDVIREGPAMAPAKPESPKRSRVTLTHPDRVLWEEQGLTKQGLADFYTEIAPWILPHVTGRPLSLVRCPSGAEEGCFFAKHPWAGLHDAVRRVDIGDGDVLVIDDLDGLMALVQAGVLEIHPWGARADDPERPDRLIFDFDPGDGVGWPDVIAAARDVRERLATLKLESFVKTTGGKGLHVVVPLTPKAGWEEAKSFAAGIAAAMTADAPDRYTDTMAKKAREGRIFVDYLRNGRGATAVAPYSTRARPGAPVSVPLAWDELSPALKPNHYTVANLPARLAHLRADPWAAMAGMRQVLPAAPKSAGAKARRR